MKKIIILALMLSALIAEAQQEPQYTQNQFNSQLEINPAYAGANDQASTSLRYRKQWVGFDGSPSTLSFNGEGKLLKKTLAAGLSIIRDEIGITQSTSADLSLASHIRVNEKGYISVGLKAGVNFLNSDFFQAHRCRPNRSALCYRKSNTALFGSGGTLLCRAHLHWVFNSQTSLI